MKRPKLWISKGKRTLADNDHISKTPDDGEDRSTFFDHFGGLRKEAKKPKKRGLTTKRKKEKEVNGSKTPWHGVGGSLAQKISAALRFPSAGRIRQGKRARERNLMSP